MAVSIASRQNRLRRHYALAYRAHSAGQESGRKPSALFTNPELVFIGKISYGMYIFHLPLAWDVSVLYNVINYRLPAVLLPYQAYIVFAENMVLLVGLAWASWVLFERPILRFKRYFEYQNSAPRPVAG